MTYERARTPMHHGQIVSLLPCRFIVAESYPHTPNGNLHANVPLPHSTLYGIAHTKV